MIQADVSLILHRGRKEVLSSVKHLIVEAQGQDIAEPKGQFKTGLPLRDQPPDQPRLPPVRRARTRRPPRFPAAGCPEMGAKASSRAHWHQKPTRPFPRKILNNSPPLARPCSVRRRQRHEQESRLSRQGNTESPDGTSAGGSAGESAAGSAGKPGRISSASLREESRGTFRGKRSGESPGDHPAHPRA